MSLGEISRYRYFAKWYFLSEDYANGAVWPKQKFRSLFSNFESLGDFVATEQYHPTCTGCKLSDGVQSQKTRLSTLLGCRTTICLPHSSCDYPSAHGTRFCATSRLCILITYLSFSFSCHRPACILNSVDWTFAIFSDGFRFLVSMANSQNLREFPADIVHTIRINKFLPYVDLRLSGLTRFSPWSCSLF